MTRTKLSSVKLAVSAVALVASIAACSSGGDGNKAKSPASTTGASTNCARDSVANSPTSGKSQVKGRMVSWNLVQPIIDNRNAFAKYFPCGAYGGDIGDSAMLNKPGDLGDHSPVSQEVFSGAKMSEGWVYAQDFMNGDGFDKNDFVGWLVTNHAAYPEVKYIHIDVGDGGLTFDDEHGWKGVVPAGDPSVNVHISYKPPFGGVGYERAHSTMMADYAKSIGRA